MRGFIDPDPGIGMAMKFIRIAIALQWAKTQGSARGGAIGGTVDVLFPAHKQRIGLTDHFFQFRIGPSQEQTMRMFAVLVFVE